MEAKIALNKLKISPRNVRKVSSSKEEDRQLIASIAAHGLLQNLVVIPAQEEGVFEVVAGGRRFAALTHLLNSNTITGELEVTCKIADENDATELSTAENLKADMHPADLFVAFKSMLDAGRSAKDIAFRFGRTQKEVKQLLRLADVSPVIVDAFRRDEVDLDVVIAFTLSDDLDRQESVFKDLQGGFVSPHVVRSRLLASSVTSDSSLVKFVTLKAYEKAGGATSTDLFADLKYINDIELLEKLGEEKMSTLVAAIKKEGWKWVETSFTHWIDLRAQRVKGELQGVPEDLTQRIDAASNESSVLSEKDTSDFSDDQMDEHWDEEQRVDSLIEELEEELEQYRVFTSDIKKVGGATICLTSKGTPEITFGYVRSEDLPKQGSISSGANPTEQQSSGDNSGVAESNALKTDLGNYELQAMRSVLMSSPDLCFDLAAFTLAQSMFSFGWNPKAANISITTHDMNATKDIAETKAAQAIESAKSKLNLAWLDCEGQHDQFREFQMLTRNDKKAIHAFCIGASLSSSNNDIVKLIASQVQFNLADHWQPTKENYFNRLKKDDILRIASDLKGEDFGKQHVESKKADLAGLVASLDEVKGWIPSSLSH
tara:strand:- start:29249 stop:31057 length:1809 start_codon:yes stop_codon:yes gene_type:complete